MNHFFDLATTDKIYVIPLRASWGMQMHSKFLGVDEGDPSDFVPALPGDAYKDFMLPSGFNRNCVRPY